MSNYIYQKPKKIDWLNQIPAHWKEVRLGSLFTQRKEKVSDIDYSPLSVTKNGVVPQLDNAAKSNDGSNRKLVLKGDFAINSRSDRKGSSGVSIYDGSVSLIYIVLKPIKIEPRYSEYLLKSYYFKEEYYRYGRGIVEDLWTTRYSEMKNMLIPSAPLKEQTAIANFLDYKLEKINRFITKKKQLIELLIEQKSAIINKAVTKGINTNVKLKPSGIEWLGDIPEHWEVRKFSNEIFFQEGPGIMAVDFKDTGVPLIRISGVKDEYVSLYGCNFLDPAKVEKKWGHFKLEIGDIIISGSASTELSSEVNKATAGAIAYTGLIRLKPRKPTIKKDYIKLFVGSKLFHTQIDLQKTGSTMQHFGPTHLKRMFVILPSVAEQEGILSFIDNESFKVNKIILTIEKELTLVEEYKTALIAEAVTGKINVRDLEIPQQETLLAMVAEEAENYNKEN